ncbi:MAG: carboxypeptidase regulatory-like domain-containing protein [Anaerolineales bacterium]|nr:carboxypeptidase regulatory-like domain-containing protein [Anaerolineales bacterium]
MRSRRRLLLAFLVGDLALAVLVVIALRLVTTAPAPDTPLPQLVAALPSLTLAPPQPLVTYPATPTNAPPASATPPPPNTHTRGPVVSETLAGAESTTPTSTPAPSGTATQTATLPGGAPPRTPSHTPTRAGAAASSATPPGTPTVTPTRTRTSPPTNTGSPTHTPTITLTPPPSHTSPPTHTLPPPSHTSPPTNTLPPPSATLAPPPPPPSGGFVGMNGGPLEGNNSLYPYQGNLSHNPMLRAASFGWLARAGVQWYREYCSDDINFSWAFVEQQSGVYDWTVWDYLVSAAQANNINLLASIGNSVPPWANGTDNWRQPPSDLYHDPWEETAWYRFVSKLVERYDGDGQDDMPGLTRPVKYWEVWNEPDLRQGWNGPNYPAHQFNGNAQDYVRLLSVAYSAIKHADPSALVVGPAVSRPLGFVYDPQWTMWDWNSFVNAGGLNAVDILSFHVYFDRTNWDADGTADYVLNLVDNNRGGKPVWVTETGWDGDPYGDHTDKARNLVRSAVIFWSKPFMGRYFWYSWQESETHEGSAHKGLLQTTNGVPAVGVEPDPLFHPAYRALDVMNRVLRGYGTAERPVALDVGGAARAYKFNAQGREVWVVWNRAAGGTTSLNLDTGGRALRMIGLYGEDLGTFGGGALTVGPNPIYLTTELNWNPNVGRITGRVRRAALGAVWGNGAAGVTVTLTGPVNAAVTTNADGNYVFENLPDGNYTVSVAGAAPLAAAVGRELPWGRTSFTIP